MNPRTGVYGLLAAHGIKGDAAMALLQFAGVSAQPGGAARYLRRGMGVLAMALLGLALILWIAANWGALSRGMRFGLLEGVTVLAAAGAIWRPALRAPLLLLAFLAQGAALAFFGQTYQTGADVWQLFAMWALLGLPFAFGARSDVVWAPWVLVAMCAVALWGRLYDGVAWQLHAWRTQAHLIGWAAMLLVMLPVLPASRVQDRCGAGVWAFRLAVLLAAFVVGGPALFDLFVGKGTRALYALGLLLCGAGFIALVVGGLRDVFVLSALAMTIDTLLVCGLARLMFANHQSGSEAFKLLFIGVVAAALVGASVLMVLRMMRTETGSEASA